MREINVSRAGDPVHAGDKALTLETPTQRGRVNRYGLNNHHLKFCKMLLNQNSNFQEVLVLIDRGHDDGHNTVLSHWLSLLQMKLFEEYG